VLLGKVLVPEVTREDWLALILGSLAIGLVFCWFVFVATS
jgi:hypothetical protein